MEKRIGFIGIILENREKNAHDVNRILTEYGDNIIARLGVPYKEKKCSVITLVIDMTTDQLGALTGKLGALKGVSIKSALAQGNK